MKGVLIADSLEWHGEYELLLRCLRSEVKETSEHPETLMKI